MTTLTATGHQIRSANRLFQIKVVLLVMLLVLGWVLLEYTSLLYKSYQIELKKQWFIQENNRLLDTNSELEKRYEYYQTDYFFQKEAKRKLNKKEPGEKVLIVSGGEQSSVSSNSWVFGEDFYQKWMEYLFGTEGEGNL